MRAFTHSAAAHILAICTLSLAASPSAYAQATSGGGTSACLSSYEQTQSLRKAGKLHDAKKRALECASASCPGVLARDCQTWITEIDASMPTVIFDVRGPAGEEFSQVTVYLDDKKLVDHLDGKSIEVEPGTHKFRFEPNADKTTSKEVTAVIREGEKFRKISASFEDKNASKAFLRPTPPAVYVFGGIGLVGLAAGTFFALRGHSEKSDLDSCKPTCNPGDVNTMSRNYAIADIAFGVGVVSGAAAIYLYLTRPQVEAAPPSMGALRNFSVAPTQGGARASWGIRF